MQLKRVFSVIIVLALIIGIALPTFAKDTENPDVENITNSAVPDDYFPLMAGGAANPNDPIKRAEAAYVTKAPIFGTDDALWDAATPFDIDQVIYDFGDTVPASGVARVLWDDDGLYVRVEVTDDSIFMNTTTTPRQLDSVEVMVSERNNRGFNLQNGNPTSGGNIDSDATRIHARLWSNVYRLSAPADSGTGQFGRAQSKYVNNLLGANWSNTAANIAENDWALSTKTAGGYVAEYRLPHRDGAVAKKDGLVMGFDIQINDVKDAASLASRRIVTWNTLNNNNTETSMNWGELELTGWAAANTETAKFTAQENGNSGWKTSTAFELAFSKDVADLELEDITLGGLSGITATGLTKVSSREYILDITGVTAPAATVMAARDVTISIDHEDVDDKIITVHVYYEMNSPPKDYEYFVSVYDPEFDTKMPSSEGLNDPFQFYVTSDGKSGGFGEVIPDRVVTEQDWINRREEIKALSQYYWYGTTGTAAKGLDIKDVITNVTVSNAANPVVTVSLADNGRTSTASFTITMPSDANITTAGYNPDNLPFGIGQNFTAYGIAQITVPAAAAYTGLYPADFRVTGLDAGQYLIYAWRVGVVPAALEWLRDKAEAEEPVENSERALRINPLGGFVNGVSIGGKEARSAAMFNDRIAISAAAESGGDGGMSLFRYLPEARLYNYAGARQSSTFRYPKFYNLYGGPASSLGWLSTNVARKFDEYNKELMPFDTHLMTALMAPVGDQKRAFIEFTNDTLCQGWTAPEVTIMNYLAAKEVFDFLGSDNIAIRARDGQHATQARDLPYIVATVDHLFGPEKENIGIRATGLFNATYPNNSLSSEYYTKLSDLTVYPYDVPSGFIRWSRPGKDMLYTTTQFVTEGLPGTVEVYTDSSVTGVSLKVSDHGDLNPTAPSTLLKDYGVFSVSNGRATISIPADETRVGRYELTTVGENGKEKRSVYFHGLDVHTALRHDWSDASHTTRALGFTSRINQKDVRMFYNDVELPISTIEQEVPNEPSGFVMQYGVSHPLAANGNRVRLENLQLEAMPGYTFTLYIRHQATDNPIWTASEAVQRNTNYANWPPFRTATAQNNGGQPENREDGSTPIIWSPTATNFNSGVHFDFDYAATDNQLIISFTEAMDPGDFGIGFDFSDDFAINWAEDDKSVAITFNSITKAVGESGGMYIMRLADANGNLIASPISKTFDLSPGIVVNTDKHLVQNGDYFNVSTDFNSASISTNAAIVTYEFDSSVFEYRGVTAADGISLLGTPAVGNGVVKFTVANLDNYSTKSLLSAQFSATVTGAELARAEQAVTVNVEYVYLDANSIKSMQTAAASSTFLTTGPDPDPDDPSVPGTYTLIHLSNVIDLFNIKAGDPEWIEARFYDFNNNGVIDIFDVSYIASKI